MGLLFLLPKKWVQFYICQFYPSIHGHAYSLMYFIEPVFKPQSRFFLTYRGAIGISYLNSPFHPLLNPLNLFYSSHLSFPLQITLIANYTLNNNLLFTLSGQYNQITNEGIK